MGKQKERQIMEACSWDSIQILEPYLVNAFEKEKSYLLALDADRLLAGFMETAGFTPKTAMYPGWESTEIRGHTAGHYLTALSQAYAGTKEKQFADRVNVLCSGLKKCQREDGYLFAMPEEIFDRLENHQPAWVPWYTLHKILAGLVCAYQLTGNRDAYETALKLGDWVYQRTMRWTEDVRREVLAVEYGGMNDALYELYQISKEEKYLAAAQKFDEEELFEKIYSGKDILNNLHANTTIPKILGAINRYLVTGEEYYLKTAENFWNMVVGSHTYIIGGNSEWERFGKPNILDAERTACNCETCNIYNMLKLTKTLYAITGKKSYMDFYERAWLNGVLSSQNPETGMTMYFQPMETGFFKVYQDPFSSFWCCGGTGMENFTKLQDGLYFKKEDALYITRYISSRFKVADWRMEVTMDVHFPETDFIKMQIDLPKGQEREIFFRIPDWTEGDARLAVDGERREEADENGYLKCSLEGSHMITLTFHPQIKAHCLPDNTRSVAFTYGPVVLCAGLGRRMLDVTSTGVQVKIPTKKLPVKDYLILQENTPEEWLSRVQDRFIKKEGELSFSLKGTDEDGMVFVPYYSQHKERYGIYWTLYQKDSDELKRMGEKLKQRKKMEDTAIDMISVGNDQYELAHKICGTNTEASWEYGYNYREIKGKGSFQYEMDMAPQGCILTVTYGKYDIGDEFDILIDGKQLIHEKLTKEDKELYTKSYDLTESVLGGKRKATVTFCTLTEHSHCRIFQALYIRGIEQEKKEEEEVK